MLSHLGKEYKQIFKDIPLKEDKSIRETMDKERFYRVVDNVLYLPSIHYIKGNVQEFTKIERVFEEYYSKPNTIPSEWLIENFNAAHYSEKQEVLELIEFLGQQKLLAVDIETTSLSMMEAETILIVFAWGEDDTATMDNFGPEVIEALKKLFAREDINFVWHNGKYDISVLKKDLDIDARIDHDTMLQHYIGFNSERGTHALGYLAMLRLGAPNWEKELDTIRREVCSQKKIKLGDFNYSMFPKEDLINYGYFDGLATFRLFKHFSERMDNKFKFIYGKLIEAANIFAEIEQAGVYVDQEVIADLEKSLNEEHDKIMEEMQVFIEEYWDAEKYVRSSGAKSYPESFNENSSQQLKWMFQEMGHNIGSTAVGVISKLDSEFADIILRLRTNNKFRSDYVGGIKAKADKDNRVRTNFNLHGTVTGRLSSSGPNLQNIPRDVSIKNIFRAAPGYLITGADYSQAELRVLTYLSDDEWLKNIYVNNLDLHDNVARQYYGEDFEDKHRDRAKRVNFGVVYGISPSTLKDQLDIPFGEARKLLDSWFDTKPQAKKFVFGVSDKAARGETLETVFGRTREFLVTPMNKNNVRREARNFQIQSTASDLTLFSIIEMTKKLKAEQVGEVILTVHDSILVEHLPEHTERVKEIMEDTMVNLPKKYLDTDIPFVADTKTGIHWGEVD